jgi:hypothetical protein
VRVREILLAIIYIITREWAIFKDVKIGG